jgi:large subunit ribosomal protein L35
MPKMKTHKGTKKRFRLTATGKVKHRHAGTSHLATRKTHKQKRNLRGTTVTDVVHLKRLHIALNGHSY